MHREREKSLQITFALLLSLCLHGISMGIRVAMGRKLPARDGLRSSARAKKRLRLDLPSHVAP